MELTLPKGETPRLRAFDGGRGTVELPGVGKFAFVPRVQSANTNVVLVDVYDGDQVQTPTKPAFTVRILSVASK
jgi:hypothetical protein